MPRYEINKSNIVSMKSPTALETTAPNAQDFCPGYNLEGVSMQSNGMVAQLALAGAPCNVYGQDYTNLTLNVTYDTNNR